MLWNHCRQAIGSWAPGIQGNYYKAEIRTPKFDSKSIQNRFKIDSKSIQNRFKIDSKSIQNQFKIDSKSIQNRFKIDSKSIQKHCWSIFVHFEQFWSILKNFVGFPINVKKKQNSCCDSGVSLLTLGILKYFEAFWSILKNFGKGPLRFWAGRQPWPLHALCVSGYLFFWSKWEPLEINFC